jgi:uncharacterized membrane protein
MDIYLVRQVFEFIANIIKVIAFLIVIWGVFQSMIQFVKLEYKDLNGVDVSEKRDNIRHHLGSYLLFGFEVLIAGDLIVTLLEPSIQELASLLVIVLVRTVLNFFLNKELHENLKVKKVYK